MRAHLWVFLTLTAGWTTSAKFAKRVYRRGNLPGQHTYNIGVKIISEQIEALPRRGGGCDLRTLMFFEVQSVQRAPYQKVSRPTVSFQRRYLYMPGKKRVTSQRTDKARARVSRPKSFRDITTRSHFEAGRKALGTQHDRTPSLRVPCYNALTHRDNSRADAPMRKGEGALPTPRES
jgi:hypothetical protein